MAGKKIRIGEIRVTRTVTWQYRQNIQTRQSIEYDKKLTYLPHAPSSSVPAISTSSAKVSLPKPSTSIVRPDVRFIISSGKRHRQPGEFSLPIETLFDAFEDRRKPEGLDKITEYDVFVSHASEDKAGYVDDLISAFREAGIKVWYDDTALEWGKSLRQQIDEGIKRAKYGIVVLSKNFFKKTWTNRELNGILAKEIVTGATPLPIWYDLTYEDVYNFSPILADIKAFPTKQYSIGDICQAMQLTLQRAIDKDG